MDAIFSRILNKPVTTTSEIIRGLSGVRGSRNLSAGSSRYTDTALTLDPLVCNLDANNNGTMTLGSVSDRVRRIGGGTYGTIFLGTSGAVYKRVMLSPDRINPADPAFSIEDFHRELFVEPFIQTVLQSDERYGRNIANIQRVYRDSTVVRPTASRSAAASSQFTQPRERTYVYYYKMEPIQNSLESYISNTGLASTLEDYETVAYASISLALSTHNLC